MGSSKKDKKSKDKRKRKHKSQERSRSRSRERKHKKDRKHDRDDPSSKRRREERREEREKREGGSESPPYGREAGSPPPRVKSDPDVKQDADAPPSGNSAGGGGDMSLSIEETNKLRAKLGLKPLDVPGVKQEDGKAKKEDVHVPAVNMREKQKQDQLRQKLLEAREKRRVNKLLGKVKTLGESDSEDDAHAWVEKSRKRQQEKQRAEKTAKMLAQMDEEFGIGDLVEQEFGSKKEYGSKDLRGLRVEHAQDRFSEGKTVILTLKDKGILDEEDDDTLVNVNLQDDETAEVNVHNKKKLPDYKPYDEAEFDEYGVLKPKQILEKYSEEIDGKKKELFQLGAGGKYDATQDRRLHEIKAEIQQQGQTLKLPAPQIATEYFTQEELSFKKVKKKVRKIRKKNKVVTADDLMPLGDDEANEDFGNRRRRRRRHQEEGELEEDVPVKQEPSIPGLDLVTAMPTDLITDDTEAPEEDLAGVVVEEDGAALELQLALNKTRKLTTKAQRQNMVQSIAETVPVKEEESDSDTDKPSITRTRAGNIVLNGTSEFCRSLGDIPTYGQAGNRAEEEEDELLDFERELERERRLQESMEDDSAAPGWQQVEVMDTAPVEIVENEEVSVMEEEPMLNTGLGAALDLAKKKGYLEKEMLKSSKHKPSKTRIEADNYSIEDKRYDDLDEKYNRKRDRFSGGMVSDFSEKRGYRPDIKLEYFDEKGHKMNHKEAFRYLSHRFHGKGSGKLKTEKRKKKIDQEQLMLSMTSTDTPLNTASMLEGKLKQEQTPFLVLSGANKAGPSSLSKS